jgi:thioredoxin-dependent peroxiredoxin
MTTRAPDFILPDQNGTARSLKDYRGRWVVLYFYPYDGSINCSREACNFRDEYHVIRQFGNAEVIGINKGSVNSHKKFAEKYRLTFPILSDTGHKVTSAFGAWRSNKPKFYDTAFGTRRNTYIINPDGDIVKHYLAVDPNTHVEEVIQDLQLLQAQAVA